MTTTNENAPDQGTREQLETLARWMGWKVETRYDGRASWAVKPPNGDFFVYLESDIHHGPRWNPFTDANADYQVLERAREVWRANASPDYAMFVGQLHHSDAYTVGDYARAVLTVLAQEGQA